MLSKFVRPKPNLTLIRFLAPVNDVVCLKGIPLLRDVPLLNRIPGIRGICNVRHIDFPAADRERLINICDGTKIVFLGPNHPEFFTDWMLDKYVTSRTCQLAANWATHEVVNGLGKAMQKFWLANNLIAQIPGNPGPSRAYSVEWAGKGHGVLLHPEGGVGWHSNFIAPLFPGVLQMAREALADNPGAESYVAPIVWKLVFEGDVTNRLHKECTYIESKLKLARGDTSDIAARVFSVYQALLQRDEKKSGLNNADGPYRDRQLALIALLRDKLRDAVDDEYIDAQDDLLLRGARRWMREHKDDPNRKQVRDLVATIARHEALADYAFSGENVTQEELADHIKRIRRDYCKASLKDTLNAYIPQAAGRRTAHIRVPEPFAVHGSDGKKVTLEDLRASMQASLDAINTEVEARNGFIKFANPFRD